MADYKDNISQNDLYIRLIPAFNTKIREWERAKFYNASPIDMWNYCIKCKWINKSNLRLYELVDDILNIDLLDYIEFIRKDRND